MEVLGYKPPTRQNCLCAVTGYARGLLGTIHSEHHYYMVF